MYVLDRYISKLSKEAKEEDLFYCHLLPTVSKSPDDPWYTAVPVGRGMLQTMVCDMCEEVGERAEKNSHSFRVSGTTGLFVAGVPERIIQFRTRHSSLEAL